MGQQSSAQQQTSKNSVQEKSEHKGPTAGSSGKRPATPDEVCRHTHPCSGHGFSTHAPAGCECHCLEGYWGIACENSGTRLLSIFNIMLGVILLLAIIIVTICYCRSRGSKSRREAFHCLPTD